MPSAQSGHARWWTLGALPAAAGIAVFASRWLDDASPAGGEVLVAPPRVEASRPPNTAKTPLTEPGAAPVQRALPAVIAKNPFGVRAWGNGTLPAIETQSRTGRPPVSVLTAAPAGDNEPCVGLERRCRQSDA